MNSYRNSAHEERTVDVLKRRFPKVYVTRGTELSREWYEYERTATAAANAYVGPQVSDYVARLEHEFRAQGFAGTLFMMGSNGGVLSAQRAIRQPIALVESGPIGGCIGAGAFAEAVGLANVIALDMGGTTAKCALVEDGRFSVEQIYYAGGYARGFPIKLPVIDIVEIGSGGGSTAWLDRQQRVHVGPHSAGSEPGPVCYGRGGTEPTVTDANLVLGRIDPNRFLGGELAIDRDAASKAIRSRIAEPLGYDGESGTIKAADGIVSIATVAMAAEMRRQTIEHGRDPRDFVLLSYGGGGPLHASALARELSIPMVVIPPEPGNFSAIGMLMADVRLDTSQTFVGALDETTVASMKTNYAAMERESQAAIRHEIGADGIGFARAAEMRYRGQRHNIKVPVGDLADVRPVREAFDRDYERRYGHADKRAGVEIQALHVAATAELYRPEIAHLRRRQDAGQAGTRGRPVYFASTGKFLETPVYDRFALASGFAASGPAIIEEYGSTTVVLPEDRFEVGPLGEIRIDCTQKEISQRGRG